MWYKTIWNSKILESVNQTCLDVQDRENTDSAAAAVRPPIHSLPEPRHHTQLRLTTLHSIAEGQYYEAHQQLRVITSRYLKASPPNYNAAFDLLASGAQALFEAGQGGSGGDLCLYLVDTYGKAELRPDAASKGRVLSLLRAFPEGEPTKKRFVNEMVG